MIEAELPDGTILEFPDGTDKAVIQRVVKQRLGVSQPAPQAQVSALEEVGIPDLFAAIEGKLSVDEERLEIVLKPEMGEARAWLFRHGNVISQKMDENGMETVTVILSGADAARFKKRVIKL